MKMRAIYLRGYGETIKLLRTIEGGIINAMDYPNCNPREHRCQSSIRSEYGGLAMLSRSGYTMVNGVAVKIAPTIRKPNRKQTLNSIWHELGLATLELTDSLAELALDVSDPRPF